MFLCTVNCGLCNVYISVTLLLKNYTPLIIISSLNNLISCCLVPLKEALPTSLRIQYFLWSDLLDNGCVLHSLMSITLYWRTCVIPIEHDSCQLKLIVFNCKVRIYLGYFTILISIFSTSDFSTQKLIYLCVDSFWCCFNLYSFVKMLINGMG